MFGPAAEPDIAVRSKSKLKSVRHCVAADREVDVRARAGTGSSAVS